MIRSNKRWRKFHIAELYNLYSSKTIINEWVKENNKNGRTCSIESKDVKCIEDFGWKM
jgi:hypothetical protein